MTRRFIVYFPAAKRGIAGSGYAREVRAGELPHISTPNPDGTLAYAIFIEADCSDEAVSIAKSGYHQHYLDFGDPGVSLPGGAEANDDGQDWWDDDRLFAAEGRRALIAVMEERHERGWASIEEAEYGEALREAQAKHGMAVYPMLFVTWAIVGGLVAFGWLLDDVPWLFWAIVGPMLLAQCVLTPFLLSMKRKYGLR